MPSPKAENKKQFSFLWAALSKVLDLLAAWRLLVLELKQNIVEQGDWFLRRVEYLFIVYLWISIGLLFLILGLFYMAIDYGQLPRGLVFSVGGLVVFLAAVVLLQTTKIKKIKR